MKRISAYIKPFRLESVITHLTQEGIVEVLVSEVRGYGRQKGHLDLYKDYEYELVFLPKANVEIICEDAALENILKELIATARSGRIGDGKILIQDVEQSFDL